MKGLIIFLIPPQEVISGGIMSIFSLAEESRKLKSIHNSDVFVSVYPGAESYKKNHLFTNSEKIYEFDRLLATHNDIDKLLIHIPEYEVADILPSLIERINIFPSELQINILNQNIEHMPSQEVVAELYKITPNITQTVAHQRYASQDIADAYLIPTHLLTVYLDQSQYIQKDFDKKEKLILYSPDDNSHKTKVLRELAENLSEYEFLEINNVTYSQYKKLIAKAAYTITFGEGFDGYFIEPAFSGSIPIAVYNDTFFPSMEYKKFPNVFTSYDGLSKSASSVIKGLDKAKYNSLNSSLAEELAKTYSRNVYVKNIQLFYERKYTFKPSSSALLTLFTKTVIQEAQRVRELEYLIQEKDSKILKTEEELRQISAELSLITQSKVWQYASRLRSIIHLGR